MWSVRNYPNERNATDNHIGGPSKAAKYIEKEYGIQIRGKGTNLEAYFPKTGKSYLITSWDFFMVADFTITNETAIGQIPHKAMSQFGVPTEYPIFKGMHEIARQPEDPATQIMKWYIDPDPRNQGYGTDKVGDPANFTSVGTTFQCHDEWKATWSSTDDDPNQVRLVYSTSGYK